MGSGRFVAGGVAPVAELDLAGPDLQGGALVAVGVGPFAVGQAAFDDDLVALVLALGDEVGGLAEGDDADLVDRLLAIVAAAVDLVVGDGEFAHGLAVVREPEFGVTAKVS